MSPEQQKDALQIIQQLRAVVCDFMPNIGNCALQDYGRLNTAMIRSRAILEEAGMTVPDVATSSKVQPSPTRKA